MVGFLLSNIVVILVKSHPELDSGSHETEEDPESSSG